MRHPDAQRLSALLDGDCDPSEARKLQRHLEQCGVCRTVFEQLEDLRDRARDLPDHLPARDLWPDIVRAMGSAPEAVRNTEPEVIPLRPPIPEVRRGGRRTFQVSLPQAVAAGLALALFSGAVGARVAWSSGPAVPVEVGDAVSWVQLVERANPELQATAREVQRLEAILGRYRSELDPEVVWALEKNLGTIDRAIQESVIALDENPGNGFLMTHLEESVRAKEDYLREATRVVAPVT